MKKLNFLLLQTHLRHDPCLFYVLVTTRLSLCSLELCEWRGQNQRTLVVGWFPASLTVPSLPPAAAPPVAVTPGPNPVPGSSYISAPVKGSLHHVGHGDIKADRSWGTPESLEESVLLLSEIIVYSLRYIPEDKALVYISINWQWDELAAALKCRNQINTVRDTKFMLAAALSNIQMIYSPFYYLVASDLFVVFLLIDFQNIDSYLTLY